MKKTILAAVLATFATSAVAGSYADPIVEPIVIIEDTSSSGGGGWIVPAMFLLIVLAASR